MNLEELKNVIIPLSVGLMQSMPKSEETETKSAIRTATFEWNGETFRVIDQNKKKIDTRTNELSKFAKLASAGHEVFWIIRERIAQWYLVVDGRAAKPQYVANDGRLIDGAYL